MKRFLITYWLSICLLFAIFYWELSPISIYLNNIQTNLTSFLTSLTLPSVMMENHHIFISPKYQLVIEKACNGIIPYLFCLAPIIAFPATLIHKIKWAIFAYLIIIMINIFRIWFITQLVLQEPSNFSLAHNYLGNIMLILTSLILFILFVKTRDKKVSYN
ncbi:MAG: archaeosortase/exosortase family protein [Sulfurovaceae bacterium]|nr:archaeosortase/exosortase family protein [Sulfurovaceae bacterium]